MLSQPWHMRPGMPSEPMRMLWSCGCAGAAPTRAAQIRGWRHSESGLGEPGMYTWAPMWWSSAAEDAAGTMSRGSGSFALSRASTASSHCVTGNQGSRVSAIAALSVPTFRRGLQTMGMVNSTVPKNEAQSALHHHRAPSACQRAPCSAHSDHWKEGNPNHT